MKTSVDQECWHGEYWYEHVGSCAQNYREIVNKIASDSMQRNRESKKRNKALSEDQSQSYTVLHITVLA